MTPELRCIKPEELKSARASTLVNSRFNCSCGRTHFTSIQAVQVGDAISGLIRSITCLQLRSGKDTILIVMDNHTEDACGRDITAKLRQAGFQLASWCYQTEHPLVPDEKALGQLLLATTLDIGVIVVVGSGTLNDLGRMVSFRCQIPYIVVATAPSVDGYASTVSPLMIDGHKTTLEAWAPVAIFADESVLQNAPNVMLQAGFGDMLGKVTALTDWQLAREMTGEYFCPEVDALVKRALDGVMQNASGIANRDAKAVSDLFESLVLSGLAMGMIGNSRPASGAEHHLAHYWEMDALRNGVDHALHGNAVGAATVAIAKLYEKMATFLPPQMNIPNSTELQRLLVLAGASENPKQLGISKSLFKRSMCEAMHVRPRYTIFRLASERGVLEQYAEDITEEFYGGIDG